MDVVKAITPVILSHFVVVITNSDLQSLLELQVGNDKFPFADLVIPYFFRVEDDGGLIDVVELPGQSGG